jgi:hypothetical protein
MKHRRHEGHAIREVIMIHRGSASRSVFDLINTTLPEVGLCARISSRITTVIRVVRYHQINYN